MELLKENLTGCTPWNKKIEDQWNESITFILSEMGMKDCYIVCKFPLTPPFGKVNIFCYLLTHKKVLTFETSGKWTFKVLLTSLYVNNNKK